MIIWDTNDDEDTAAADGDACDTCKSCTGVNDDIARRPKHICVACCFCRSEKREKNKKNG